MKNKKTKKKITNRGERIEEEIKEKETMENKEDENIKEEE